MPGMPRLVGPWISEGLELQPVGRNTHRCAVGQESGLVRRDEMRHRTPFPDVPMQPQPAIHRVDHSVAPANELTQRISSGYWQPGTPSCCAGAGIGDTFP